MIGARRMLGRLWSRLAAVQAVPVGQAGDGLVMRPAGTPLDKPWHELQAEFTDAREAWRKNPLARRMVGLTTAYAVGSGIVLHCDDGVDDGVDGGLDDGVMQEFVQSFWQHNGLDLRLAEWSDELCRAGELFPVLFTNPVSGMSSVRLVPAARIEAVDFDPDDYERELSYRESTAPGTDEKWWLGVGRQPPPETPLMLHYAVNRPAGALRGESDLAPILPWLRRYSGWLEDRVRLNAAMRAFLWIVHAPARLRNQLEERYRMPPEAGTVIIADRDHEQWQAVTPNLHANDAEKDGRAIRWMVVAGGPGTALLDMGEGEDSNLATGLAMAEQRRRFLRRRQSYLAWLLVDLVWQAWLRYATVRGLSTPPELRTQIHARLPDIAPEDNGQLAGAAQALVSSLQGLATLVGEGPTYRRLALQLYAKFLGERLDEAEVAAILAEGRAAQ